MPACVQIDAALGGHETQAWHSGELLMAQGYLIYSLMLI